jgi:VWFA-related protein
MERAAARVLITPKNFLISSLLVVAAFLTSATFGFAQAVAQVTTLPTGDESPFHLKVTTNLVVVRVVVRDAQNRPVENLKQEDFKLFDRGKQQAITQFAVETTAAQPTTGPETVTSVNPSAPGVSLSTVPRRFVALYFDDLNMSDADVMHARDAADRYLASNLQPTDRVGLFTSGNSLSDFTGDPKQIHDALLKLHASPVAQKTPECPELSDYQAEQIIEFDDENTDAWQVAKDQALNDQRCSQVPTGPGEPQRYIAVLARKVMEQSELQARANLEELDKVVKYVSRMPGQRAVVLVSPGYFSRSEESQLEQTIDRALRAQVVISSLDPRGLADPSHESDVSHTYMPVFLASNLHRLRSDRESAARDVLQEVAQGTGGEFLHNINDLQAGFRVLRSPSGYYLGFDPKDLKPDGKFHDLKVELAEKHKDWSVQARRGYFAPRSEAEAETLAKAGAAGDPESQAKEQLREAVFAKTELQQLPVTMDVKVYSTKTDDRELALSAHLDTRSLHFRKDGQRNLNSVTFVFAVFDQKDNLLQVQKGQAPLNPVDAQLEQVRSAGLKMDSKFELKPGVYRIREVVTDAEEHRVTALSRNVDVSAACCALRDDASDRPISAGLPGTAPNLPSNPPARANAPTYVDYPLPKLRTAVPALNGIKPGTSQDQLASILAKAGEATLNSLSRVPNLSSLEDVYSAVMSRAAGPANSVLGMEQSPALLDLEAQLREMRSVEFNYLLLFDHHPDGATAITELRTDFKNRQVSSSVDGVAPRGFGFAYQWLLLSPANQSELRFRYLGEQNMDDHKTFVLGFVQIPTQVKLPGKFKWAGKEEPFFFQGIVWIDQSGFNVVRLQTDLLAPVPSVNLLQMTTDLRFRSVRIKGYDADFWLPSQVLIRTEQGESVLNELHQYSRYKFFHAESRLLP